MTEITGGELLARALANEGLRYVFGLPCPEIDPLLAALEASGIRLVTIRHEAAAVHMAEGLYKTTGQVAVVLGNPGPGTSNLIPGLVTARHEGVPVIAITSQHRAGVVYPATPATFQGQDQIDLLKPAVKWNAPVFDWTRIPELVRMAFREAFAGRPGPVHLEVPGPTLYAEGEPATARVFTHESGRAGPPQASEAQLEAAAQLLASANRPVSFAGTGVDRAWANRALVTLAEQLGWDSLKIVAAVEKGEGSFQSVEDEALGIDHCSSGYMQAENWNLAREYSAVISLHHSAETPQRLPQEWRSMIEVVKVADTLAAFSGAGFRRPVALNDIPCHTIGITADRLYELLWHTNDMYEDYTRVLLGEPTEEV